MRFGLGHGGARHGFVLLRLGDGLARARCHGHARNEKGRPKGRPMRSGNDDGGASHPPALFARHAELWVQEARRFSSRS